MKYICTAIAYLNGAPHLGHSLDFLLADIWARNQTALGEKVLFQTGTDEHGQKVAKKALELGMPVEKLVEENSQLFRDFLRHLNVSEHQFIRTTDPEHKRRVALIWNRLKDAGYIYKNTYTGWYCEGCEGFYTASEVAESGGKCPIHHTPYTEVAEENYFLKLQPFLPRIRAAIERGMAMSVADALAGESGDYLKILPEFRAKEFLNLLDTMPDVSISRPKEQNSWGIPVPDDATQTMYVWIDALSNYITGTKWQKLDQVSPLYWPAAVQVLGKDILRFHAGIWPAMLMALELPLPKVLLVHGHIGVDGEKMSKSLGNVVSPDEILDKYGTDAFRYYFARHIPTTDDGDFSWDKFQAAYNTELANDLGNLVSRVAKMCVKFFDGRITPGGSGVNPDVDQTDNTPDLKIVDTAQPLMDELRFSDALDVIWQRIRAQNKHIDDAKPWELAKSDTTWPELNRLLTELVTNIVEIAAELDPFLPETAVKIRTIFTPDGIKNSDTILFPKEPVN